MIQKLPGARLVNDRIELVRGNAQRRISSVKDRLFRGGIVLLTASVVVWLAIFMYIVFYYTYIPQLSHTRPVHLQFRSCVDSDNSICSFPSAEIQLTKRQQILMVGQRYKINLNFEMPESEANKNLGMFMVCIQLKDVKGLSIADSCRPVMLHYRSWLLHVIKTFLYSPALLLGSAEEKQHISVEMFSDYEEDQSHPVTDLYVEIRTKKIELYSASIQIHAHFTGLRYFMFHWPTVSAALGISFNLLIIAFILLVSWYHLIYTSAGAYAQNVINLSTAMDDTITKFDESKNKDEQEVDCSKSPKIEKANNCRRVFILKL